VENPNNVGTGTNATDSSNSATGTITTGLNIRKEADADSASVGSYKKGDKVTILERSGDWGRTNKGWINTKYVDFTNTVTADSSSSSSSGGGISTTVSNGSKVILGYGTVKRTTSLAIRSGPGANYSQVSYVRMGERHPYYQTSSNGWVRFQKGWVNADYLSLEYVVVDGTEVTVTATTLSVREEADYNSERLATLAKGDKVAISGFGNFEVKAREARVGRNPRTKETIEIPATKLPAFKAAKALKDAVAK
jgi:nucleoid DNA-binding protein